jgi:hypothetical protein
MGSSASSQYEAVRKREGAVVESKNNVLWLLSENGAMDSGRGKVMLTSRGLHIWNDKYKHYSLFSCLSLDVSSTPPLRPRCDSKHHFPLTAIASAEMRDAPQEAVPFLGEACQTLVLCVGSSVASDGEEDGGGQLRMMDEICLYADVVDGGFFLADLSKEVQDRIGIQRDPGHYLERMLDMTSGRVERDPEHDIERTRMLDMTSGRADRTQRFMLHHSSGRGQRLDWEEEGGDVTTDMMRFTSGRQPRPPRFSEEDLPSEEDRP